MLLITMMAKDLKLLGTEGSSGKPKIWKCNDTHSVKS